MLWLEDVIKITKEKLIYLGTLGIKKRKPKNMQAYGGVNIINDGRW